MQIDHHIIDALMVWAKAQAPIGLNWTHRPVRLEISAEPCVITPCERDDHRRLMCRVYLAEPRCWKPDTGQPGLRPIPGAWFGSHVGMVHDLAQHDKDCECTMLAETRVA